MIPLCNFGQKLLILHDARYDQNIINNQILTYESIGDNPKDLQTTKDNPTDIPKRDIDSNNDEVVPLDDTFEEIKDKHRSRIPKNHPISNFISNVNDYVVTRR